MYSITNRELRIAKDIFEYLEGIDICSAAAVAVASLKKALDEGKVMAEDKILLNITGGGFLRLKQTHLLHKLKPNIILGDTQIDAQKMLNKLGHKDI